MICSVTGHIYSTQYIKWTIETKLIRFAIIR